MTSAWRPLRPRLRRRFGRWRLLLLVAGVGAWGWAVWYLTLGQDAVPRERYDPSYFGYSRLRTVDGRFIPATELGNSDYCGHCHSDIFHQWDASTHHFSSFNDPYYRRVALNVAEHRGDASLKFCAGCHDPLPLVGGEMPQKQLQSWSANAGITCLSCHRTVGIHGDRNAAYSLAAPTLHPFALTDRPLMQRLHGLLVKVTPFLHRAVLTKPFYSSSAFCETCHTVQIPAQINGGSDLLVQSEGSHSSHATSGLDATHPKSGATCQSCHMPLVRSNDPAARNGFIHSHRFTGGNTAIPTLNRDADQLGATQSFLSSNIVTVDIPSTTQLQVSKSSPVALSARTIDVAIRVANRAVGHSFPAGTADSNEAWIELVVRDARAVPVFSSGVPDPTGLLPAGTYKFAAQYLDRDGHPTDRRTTTTEAVALGRSTVLEAGESRTLTYRFCVPPEARFPLTATVEINWRKFSPAFTDWVFGGRRVQPLPVTQISRAERTLSLPAQGNPAASASVRCTHSIETPMS